MKAHALHLAVAGLATTALATGPVGPIKQVQTTMAEGFPWRNPFSSKAAGAFDAACEASRTFPAAEYTLHELFEQQPLGLFPWGAALKGVFAQREYPGGWAGLDRHQYNRNLLLMDYAAVPVRVREWIEEEERSDGPGQGLFAVFYKPPPSGGRLDATAELPKKKASERDASEDEEKVVIFAPGAMYRTLPLWVAAGSECEVSLSDLSKYSSEPKDGAVVAWPIAHKKPDESNKKMDFTIKAQLLKLKPEAAGGAQDEKDEL